MPAETARCRAGFPAGAGIFFHAMAPCAGPDRHGHREVAMDKQVFTAAQQQEEGWIGAASNVFLRVEHAAYVLLGAFLALAALLAFGVAGVALWQSVADWNGTQGILRIIDSLLFTLMLVEILHTVRASMKSGGLTCEPFLVVGLIASIRRVLVITLQSSETTKVGMTDESEKLFRASMMELIVLAILISVMVVAIWILQKARAKPVE
jgi:uncharacterized membrane protein (DUF373 family)